MIEVEKIEALVVAPDEVLVIRLPHNDFVDQFKDIQKALDGVGLENRYIVFGGEVEFTKVKL